MYQLTSLIRHKPEVYLSRSVALISESGSRVPRDTTKVFSQIIGLCRKLTALFNELSLLVVFFLFHSKVLRYFSRIFTILADFQPETICILPHFVDKVALKGRGFKPKIFGKQYLDFTQKLLPISI
jgi:hypothetical protein